MIDYIKGKIVEKTPTYLVLETNNLGYFINVGLMTYTALMDKEECKLYIHESIREDAWVLYGFLNKRERQVFLHLLSVSGIGANTARTILSSLSVAELEEAITSGNVDLIKSTKGIGLKTAQRMIVELKDKIGRGDINQNINQIMESPIKQEAQEALLMLGFNKNLVGKALDKLLKDAPTLTIEGLIKQALKVL